MHTVYILESEKGGRFYIGRTKDILSRLRTHNEGKSPYTRDYCPWKLRTYITFDNEKKAIIFERYLKSASGRAFQKRHF